jgi:hypothetical protein
MLVCPGPAAPLSAVGGWRLLSAGPCVAARAVVDALHAIQEVVLYASLATFIFCFP